MRQLFVYDRAPGVQYSWYNVLLSAGPKFLKEKNHLSYHFTALSLNSNIQHATVLTMVLEALSTNLFSLPYRMQDRSFSLSVSLLH